MSDERGTVDSPFGPLTRNLISTRPCIILMLPPTQGLPPANHLTSDRIGSPRSDCTAGASFTSINVEWKTLDEAFSVFMT